MADPVLLRGTLDLLILKMLVLGPMNGFEITNAIETRSGGHLDVEDSALYQALHRIEERGLVEAEWGLSEKNRQARYYRLTRQGRTHLRAEGRRWASSATIVLRILGESAAP